ncbi:MAG: hypothetical protein F6J93_15615 [Oscillatoria sp. SIO1A7]|nr:hypothetical protein [Oscillatoria sp. SIO1A7]
MGCFAPDTSHQFEKRYRKGTGRADRDRAVCSLASLQIDPLSPISCQFECPKKSFCVGRASRLS